MSNIGICGAHRTGKTTLAQQCAKLSGIPFLATAVSQVFQDMGLDPAQPLPFATRLTVQNHILDRAVSLWANFPDQFITDRTPIDMMAYTLADIQGTTEVQEHRLQAYLDRCFQATNQYFRHLVIVPPAIPLVFAAGKAALNPAYIQHIHFLVVGLSYSQHISPDIKVVPLPEQIISLPDRVEFVRQNLDLNLAL